MDTAKLGLGGAFARCYRDPAIKQWTKQPPVPEVRQNGGLCAGRNPGCHNRAERSDAGSRGRRAWGQGSTRHHPIGMEKGRRKQGVVPAFGRPMAGARPPNTSPPKASAPGAHAAQPHPSTRATTSDPGLASNQSCSGILGSMPRSRSRWLGGRLAPAPRIARW